MRRFFETTTLTLALSPLRRKRELENPSPLWGEGRVRGGTWVRGGF